MGNRHRDDPLVSVLKDRGYLLVRLPRADIEPLLLIRRPNDGNFERIGQLTHGLVPRKEEPLPPVTMDTPVADMDGKKTSDLDIETGVNLVGSLVGALGGDNIGLDAEYGNAKNMSFAIHHVLEDKVEVVDVDQYLVDAEVNPNTRTFKNWLENDEIYIITSILKSNQFTTEAKKENKESVALDVPVIQEIVGAKVKVEHTAGSETRIKYEGQKPVTFGFQAVQLFYRDNYYRALDQSRGGALEVADQVKRLEIDDVMVELGENAAVAEASPDVSPTKLADS
jgi:hypothetical protein